MSHELELIPGTAAYAFAHRNAPAWHGLGQQADDNLSNAEVASLAGFDGTFEVHPLAELLKDSGIHVVTADSAVVQVRPDGARIMRSAGVSPSFEPWQPEDILRTIDALTSAGATLDTVGMLGQDGARIFMSFILSDDIDVRGDHVKPFVNLRCGYDGGLSRQIDVSPVRVVCANTFRQAWNRKSDTRVTVRNSRGANLRMIDARETLGLAFQTVESWAAEYDKLFDVEVTDEKFSEIVAGLFPDADNPRGQTRAENNREVMTDIYKTGKGKHPGIHDDGVYLAPLHDTIGAARGSLAGVVNAWQEMQTWYATPRAAGDSIDWDGFLLRAAGDNAVINSKVEAGFRRIFEIAGVSA